MTDHSITDGSSASEMVKNAVLFAENARSFHRVIEEAEYKTQAAKQRIWFLRNKLIKAEAEKDELIDEMTSAMAEYEIVNESLMGKFRKSCCQVDLFFMDDLKISTDAIISEKEKSVASLSSDIIEWKKELKELQSETFEPTGTLPDCNFNGLKAELPSSVDKVEEMKKTLKLNFIYKGLKKELDDSHSVIEKLQQIISDLESGLKKVKEAREKSKNNATCLITKLKEEITKKVDTLEKSKNLEIRKIEDRYKDIDKNTLEQNKVLAEKTKILEVYEEERSTIANLAKAGIRAAKEQTKQLFTNRSTSHDIESPTIPRLCDTKGRSRARSRALMKAHRARSRSRSESRKESKPIVASAE
mmetsp:Transcript_41399/g.81121  ORF Transcript_41399/g.81121 Transcript_41399/m.81121 type:complete len:359 (+) Transcript_41399:137-1213(+)